MISFLSSKGKIVERTKRIENKIAISILTNSPSVRLHSRFVKVSVTDPLVPDLFANIFKDNMEERIERQIARYVERIEDCWSDIIIIKIQKAESVARLVF